MRMILDIASAYGFSPSNEFITEISPATDVCPESDANRALQPCHNFLCRDTTCLTFKPAGSSVEFVHVLSPLLKSAITHCPLLGLRRGLRALTGVRVASLYVGPCVLVALSVDLLCCVGYTLYTRRWLHPLGRGLTACRNHAHAQLDSLRSHTYLLTTLSRGAQVRSQAASCLHTVVLHGIGQAKV